MQRKSEFGSSSQLIGCSSNKKPTVLWKALCPVKPGCVILTATSLGWAPANTWVPKQPAIEIQSRNRPGKLQSQGGRSSKELLSSSGKFSSLTCREVASELWKPNHNGGESRKVPWREKETKTDFLSLWNCQVDQVYSQTPFHLAFCPIPLSPCFFYSAPGSRIRAPLGVQLDANTAAPKPHIEDNDKSPLLLYLGIRSLLVPFMFLVIAE